MSPYYAQLLPRYEMLSHFQANKLDDHNFTDTSRRHETLKSETKDVVTHSNSSSQIIRILGFHFPQGKVHRTVGPACKNSMVCVTREKA